MSCGCCCGLRAPKDVYSGVVTNKTEAPVTATASYRKADGSVDEVTVTIPAGASHEFEQRTYTEETCSFTYVISKMVVAGAKNVEAAAPFPDVTSPVKGYKWTVEGTHAEPRLTMSL